MRRLTPMQAGTMAGAAGVGVGRRRGGRASAWASGSVRRRRGRRGRRRRRLRVGVGFGVGVGVGFGVGVGGRLRRRRRRRVRVERRGAGVGEEAGEVGPVGPGTRGGAAPEPPVRGELRGAVWPGAHEVALRDGDRQRGRRRSPAAPALDVAAKRVPRRGPPQGVPVEDLAAGLAVAEDPPHDVEGPVRLRRPGEAAVLDEVAEVPAGGQVGGTAPQDQRGLRGAGEARVAGDGNEARVDGEGRLAERPRDRG